MTAGETTYRLDGLAVPESLRRLRDLMQRVRDEHVDVGATDVSMIEQAVMEIAGNLVEHGGPTGGVHYSFRLDVLPDRLHGWLTDSGAPVPDSGESREMPDELAESGRGLPLAEAALDQLTYQRTEGRNSWEMVRVRRPS